MKIHTEKHSYNLPVQKHLKKMAEKGKKKT